MRNATQRLLSAILNNNTGQPAEEHRRLLVETSGYNVRFRLLTAFTRDPIIDGYSASRQAVLRDDVLRIIWLSERHDFDDNFTH